MLTAAALPIRPTTHDDVPDARLYMKDPSCKCCQTQHGGVAHNLSVLVVHFLVSSEEQSHTEQVTAGSGPSSAPAMMGPFKLDFVLASIARDEKDRS